MSQQEVKASFIGKRERVQITDGVTVWETQKERRESPLWGLGGFIEDRGPVSVFFQASRNQLEQRQGPRCYSLKPGGLGGSLEGR